VRRYTERQQQAIRAESHLLMEAGAGSGKTTTLVGKIMHALGAEVLPGERAAAPCTLDEIVAITFTEAAAADLRAALRRAIRAEAKRTGEPLWRRYLYALERARIGTIHSFCGALLREWGGRIGIDPGFRVLDETEASLLRREVVREALMEVLAAGDAALTQLVAARGFDRVRGLVERVLGKATLAARVRERWCPDGTPAAEELRALAEAGGFEWQPHDEDALRMAGALLGLADRTHARWTERLEREGVLDFDALITRAHALVHERDDIVRRLRRRIRWLFIDEFQDTDHVQKEIAYRLCALEGDEVVDPAPRLCIVGDPKQSIYRFRRADVSVWNAVADDFARRGLPVVPLDTNFRSRAPLLGFVNATFAPLLDGVPAPGGDARHEVRYAPLAAARDYAGDDDLVEVLAVPAEAGGEPVNADERRRREAELIAGRILQLVRGEACVREAEADGTLRDRLPRWKDIALLFRSRTKLAIYEAALRRAGIPYYVSSGSGFFERREVRDLVLLLTALADARDDVAWAGVLRSPWVALKDEYLLRARLLLGPRPLSHALALELPGEEGARLRRAAEWLRELGGLRDRVRPAMLVERALERSGYAEYLLLQDGGELALANLRKLVRMAESGAAGSLGEIVEWLRERAEVASREPEARLHTAGEDVVVLTTVHASKGLEWPVVFLCDLERDLVQSHTRTDELLFDEEAGLALKWKVYDAPNTAGWDRLAARERALDLAEEKRLWYVAATRARDRLVLAGCTPERSLVVDPEKGPQRVAQWLLAGLEVDPESGRVRYRSGDAEWTGRIVAGIEASGTPAVRTPPPTPDELRDAPPLPAEVALRLGALPPVRPRRRHSATELMGFAFDAEQHRRTYSLGLPARRLPATGRSGEVAEVGPREKGNIVHGVLEKLRHDADVVTLLDAEIEEQLGISAAAALSDEIRAELRRLIEQTRSYPAVRRLYESEQVEPELPFTWLLDGGGAPVALQGAMDLVALVDGVPEIVDFKTHAIRPGQEGEVAARYEIQRDAYAAALAALLGTVPGALRFVFPATGGEAATPLDEAAVEAARARVRTLIEQLHPA
jgi:ATP-dependent helicase/nuclease subunit A